MMTRPNAMTSAPWLRRVQRGFTLIEILIVVVILGVLAGIVIPQFVDASEDAQASSFITSIKTLSRAMVKFELDEGVYPEDGSSGVIPAGFDAYITNFDWGNTSIGGVWDSEFESFGITCAVGVHFDGTGETRDDAYMQTIDARFDDGDLATGAFQSFGGGRYYYIVED